LYRLLPYLKARICIRIQRTSRQDWSAVKVRHVQNQLSGNVA
jgi:hypothetical protein